MQTCELLVKGRSIVTGSVRSHVVRTSVGVYSIHVLFDSDEWFSFPTIITFGTKDGSVTKPLELRETGDLEWPVEAETELPRQAATSVGGVYVTIQGTDSEGRHIITAKGAPLSVIEAGEPILEYDEQDDAPTVSQWQQAYADAMVAVNRAASLVESLQGQLDSMVDSAVSRVEESVAELKVPATTETIGQVVVGDGLEVTESGVVSVAVLPGISNAQANAISNLSALAFQCFDTSFDASGALKDGAVVRASALPALPIATYTSPGAVAPDGLSVTIDDDGVLHSYGGVTHSWDGTVLTVTSNSGSSSSDLMGPFTEITDVTATVDDSAGDPSVEVTTDSSDGGIALEFSFHGLKGKKGDRGERGPSGYVLTDEDIELVADAILSRYELYDDKEF